MIITLTGANFAGVDENGNPKNIGTLSTWYISTDLGYGATYNGPKSVEKDAALSATVTIATGYELGSAGVSVTMGGSAVTSGVSTSGNVVTISIDKVTGKVVIKVPTKNTATGEEDGGSSGGAIETELFNGFYTERSFFTNYTDDTFKQLGVKTGSTSAHTVAIDIEDGATYYYKIDYSAVAAASRRMRLGLFNETVANLNLVTVNDSVNLSTTDCSKSVRIIREDQMKYDKLIPDVVEGYFTNTENAKSFVGLVGSSSTPLNIVVSVKKVAKPTTYTFMPNAYYSAPVRGGTDASGATQAYVLTNISGTARAWAFELEDGATYTISYTNTADDTNRRQSIALFAPSWKATDFIKVAFDNESCTNVSATDGTPAIETIVPFTSGASAAKNYEYTFTNTKNAKTLYMLLAMNVDASCVTGTVTKVG